MGTTQYVGKYHVAATSVSLRRFDRK